MTNGITYSPLGKIYITVDLKPIRVIFNNPATIVFWNDGTKTVVKCSKDDVFDKDKGFVYATLKKMLRSSRKVSEFYENNFVELEEEIKLPFITLPFWYRGGN